MSKLKLVGVKVKRPATKKADAIDWPERKAMSAFEKKYRAAEVKTGHWHVMFWPEIETRTIIVQMQGPLDFSTSFGQRSPEEIKKDVKRYKDLAAELEKMVDYAQKKQKELEKEFKALPSEKE